MPAINSLSTATTPSIALHSGNAISFPLPIKNIGNSSEMLPREKRADNFDAHEMAYSSHNQRVKRSEQSCVEIKKLACKPRQPLEFAEEYIMRLDLCNALKNCKG